MNFVSVITFFPELTLSFDFSFVYNICKKKKKRRIKLYLFWLIFPDIYCYFTWGKKPHKLRSNVLCCGSHFCLRNWKWFQFRCLLFLRIFSLFVSQVRSENILNFLLLWNHLRDQQFFYYKSGILFKQYSLRHILPEIICSQMYF